jgi:hypothetical protein
MAGNDRSREDRGAHAGQNRPMRLIGIGMIVILVLAVILLATGIGEMTPWDVGGADSNSTP